MMNIMEAENVTVKKGDRVILDSVDFKVKQGDFVAIMGKSGAGKSTLLNVLSGIERIDNGTIRYEDSNITLLNDIDLCKLRRNHFGFIFQSYNLVDELSVKDNILLLTLYEKSNGRNVEDKLKKYAAKLNVEHCLEKYPSQLSGGERQRAAIVRTLMMDSNLIFADEPTGALDSNNGRIVMDILKELNDEGKTIIMVTHDQDMASYANKIINISDGKIIA